MPARIGWVFVLVLVWGAAFAGGSLQEYFLRLALNERIGLHVSELNFYCGGVIESFFGKWTRQEDEVFFAHVRFGPRWMSVFDGQAPWKLTIQAPELHLHMQHRRLHWPKTRMNRFQDLLQWVSISFTQGRLFATFPNTKVRLEALHATSRQDGTFRLEAPIIYMMTPQGEWIGKNTVLETRGKRWERLQISFVRVMSPQGVWVDAGGSIERISSRVYGVNVYLRHADEHASFQGRVNFDEERFVVDIVFASSITSLLEYIDVFWPLKAAKSMLRGNVEGKAHVVWQKRPVLANFQLEIQDFSMFGDMFSAQAISLPNVSVETGIRRTEEGRVSFKGKVQMQGPEVVFDAVWQPGETLKIEGNTNVYSCQEWMKKGHAFLPNLQGIKLDGTFGLRFGLWFDLKDAEKFNATADFIGDGCTVIRDAPNADPTLLQHPVVVQLRGYQGKTVTRRLDPAEPTFVSLAKIPPHTVAAFLMAEDRRFREHKGFDWHMIIRAVGYNLKHRGFFKGASSISQQLVKNLYLSSTRSISRKLEEAILTWRLEQVLTKDRILELYLNIIEMGPGLFGIADGARVYFQREVRNLIPIESAHLALITPAPTFRFYALRRKNIPDPWNAQVFGLLRKMLVAGSITQEQWQASKERGLILQDY